MFFWLRVLSKLHPMIIDSNILFCNQAGGASDKSDFKLVNDAFKNIGLDKQGDTVWKIIAAILHMVWFIPSLVTLFCWRDVSMYGSVKQA